MLFKMWHLKQITHINGMVKEEVFKECKAFIDVSKLCFWGECDGTQKGGLRPTYLSLPHLTPLPVTVPTHSLNLKNPI